MFWFHVSYCVCFRRIVEHKDFKTGEKYAIIVLSSARYLTLKKYAMDSYKGLKGNKTVDRAVKEASNDGELIHVLPIFLFYIFKQSENG